MFSLKFGRKYFTNDIAKEPTKAELNRMEEITDFILNCGRNANTWHGDTFDLPEGAIHLASSEVCKNQAFIFNRKVLALQFHLESTAGSLKEMIKYGKSELVPSEYIQPDENELLNQKLISSNRELLFNILTILAG